MSTAFTCGFVIPGADELGADYRPSCGKGEEDLNHQHVYGIHKGYAGNGGFTYIGNHQHIHHAYQYRKELFHHKRPQQVKQVVFTEQ